MRVFKGKRTTVYQLNSGKFALDGGAMFGVVPKVLWNRLIPSDDLNRIPMATHPLLVKTPKGWVLIESGLGTGWDEKFHKIYDVAEEDPFMDTPIGRDEVSLIVQTHLHFDHAGELSTPDGLFRYNAPVVVQNMEWADARFPHERSRASYVQERLNAIEGKLRLVSGTAEVWDGIYVAKTGGHTRGHQIVLIRDLDRLFVFTGDLLPTQHHSPLPYVMGYDLFPEEMLFARKYWYDLFIREKALLFTPHDRIPFAGEMYIDERGKHRLREITPDGD
ncbi:MAG: MBL fold metallo-hydrolase [Thermotogae bacterium]|nr:MBL fold metallo-hydrolase [Thermotogota bacterium]